MKTALQFFSALMFFAVFNGFAYANMESKTVYEHLLEVNAQWRNYPDAAPKIYPQFTCDNQRIQFHLQLVEAYLREHTPQGFSDKALKNRLQLLDVLHQYHETAIFPTNTRHAHRQPYFIDDYGVYCAVGYLISKSGHDALAQEIHEKQNYAYIKEITVEGVAKWATEHGFTVAELAWIQPAYAPTTSVAPLGEGTNSPVKKLNYIPSGMAFIGQFTQVNGSPCLGIGKYENGQLSCYGGGIDGIVNDLAYNYFTDKLYVTGKFDFNGNTYPLASYDDNQGWAYISIPSLNSTSEGGAIFIGSSKTEVAFFNPALGKDEIWEMSHMTGNWHKRATVDGRIFVISHPGAYLYAGAFNAITIHNLNSDSTFASENMVMDLVSNWLSFSGNLSDTVLCVKNIGTGIYIGGTCTSDGIGSNVCLTRYMNGSFQPLITADMLVDEKSKVGSIEQFGTTDLIVGGELTLNQIVGTYGSQLYRYDLVNNYTQAMADFNYAVNSILRVGNEYYLGGNFTQNLGAGNFNHLAKIASATFSINEPNAEQSVSLYPNPATDYVTVETKNKISGLSVIDISGKEIMKLTADNNLEKYQLDISTLKPGIYIMMAEHAEGGRSQTKFLVN